MGHFIYSWIPWAARAGANGTFLCWKGRIDLHSLEEVESEREMGRVVDLIPLMTMYLYAIMSVVSSWLGRKNPESNIHWLLESMWWWHHQTDAMSLKCQLKCVSSSEPVNCWKAIVYLYHWWKTLCCKTYNNRLREVLQCSILAEKCATRNLNLNQLYLNWKWAARIIVFKNGIWWVKFKIEFIFFRELNCSKLETECSMTKLNSFFLYFITPKDSTVCVYSHIQL